MWSLLRSRELAGIYGTNIPFEDEALSGAPDHPLRVQDPAGYFYINVFNESWSGPRTICTWIGNAEKQGISTSDYQAAWREGGGISIAALALASRMGLDGDSSSARYLAGAKRGFAHLNGTVGKWADDGKENLIDHTVALLAATELAFAVPTDPVYAIAAGARVDSILARQHAQGWFWADGGTRVWYYGVDEGLPLVALVRYLDLDGTSERSLRVRGSFGLVAWAATTHQHRNREPLCLSPHVRSRHTSRRPRCGQSGQGQPLGPARSRPRATKPGKPSTAMRPPVGPPTSRTPWAWIAVDLGPNTWSTPF